MLHIKKFAAGVCGKNRHAEKQDAAKDIHNSIDAFHFFRIRQNPQGNEGFAEGNGHVGKNRQIKQYIQTVDQYTARSLSRHAFQQGEGADMKWQQKNDGTGADALNQNFQIGFDIGDLFGIVKKQDGNQGYYRMGGHAGSQTVTGYRGQKGPVEEKDITAGLK